MNALFLVTLFSLVLSILSGSLLRSSLFFSLQEKQAIHYLQGKRSLRNKWENYKYQHRPGKAEKKQKTITNTPLRQCNPCLSHRLRKDLPLSAKWNLIPLIEQSVNDPRWMKATETLFTLLYGHTDFWKEASEKIPSLAEELTRAILLKSSCKTFSDLFPSDPVLQEVFYRMLKGSGKYSWEKKEGYPPLKAFFSLQRENKKVLSFPQASLPALQALFGNKVAQGVLALEKEKAERKGSGHYTLNEQEFTDLFHRNAPGLSLEPLKPLIHFSTRRAPLDHLSYESPQGFLMQVRLPKKT